MRHFSLFAVVVVSVSQFAFASIILAQDRHVMFGPIASYAFGKPSSVERSAGAFQVFGSNGRGSSKDQFVAFGVESAIPVSSRWSLDASLVYGSGRGEFTSDPFEVFASSPGNQALTERFTISTSYWSLVGEASGRYAFDWAEFGAGLGFTFRTSTQAVQQLEIVSPTDQHFASGATSDTVDTSDRLTTAPFHVILPLTISRDLHLSDTWALRGSLGVSGDLTLITQGFLANAWSAGVRLSVLFPLTRSAPAPVFATSVKLRTATDVSARLVVTDTLFRREMDLPTTLTPDLCEKILASQSLHGDLSQLDRASIEECAAHTLDMLSTRVDSHDTLYVMHNGNSAPRHAAEMIVAKYGSNPAALITRSTEVFVGLRTSTSRPFSQEWIERSYSLPPLFIEKSMYSSDGIEAWDVELSQGDVVLGRSSNSNAADPELHLKTAGVTSLPIVARLFVRDSAGNTMESRDSLQILAAQHTLLSTVDERVIVLDTANTSHTKSAVTNFIASLTSHSVVTVEASRVPPDNFDRFKAMFFEGLIASGMSPASISVRHGSDRLGVLYSQPVIVLRASRPGK